MPRDWESKDPDSPLADQLLPNTPENKLAAGIAYSTAKWDAAFDVRWVDEFRWSVGAFKGNVLAYATADVRGNYNFTEHFGVGVNVANFFDEEHWESFGGDLLGRRALVNVLTRW